MCTIVMADGYFQGQKVMAGNRTRPRRTNTNCEVGAGSAWVRVFPLYVFKIPPASPKMFLDNDAGKTVQLVKNLPHKHEDLSPTPEPMRNVNHDNTSWCMMVHASDSKH